MNVSSKRLPEDVRRPAFVATDAASGPASKVWSALIKIPFGSALKRTRAKGYRLADFRADILAGTVVGIVALPLSMALAIAVGVPPQQGLYTAVIAGALVALFGGCKFQVTGPTAAFVVILAPIVTHHGLSGLVTAGFMAGVMLVVMGVARLGTLIQFIPYPVTTGFTTGIATVIATLQIKDAFGLHVGSMPDDYTGKIATLWQARASANVFELTVTAATCALLFGLPRVVKRIPAPLIAIAMVSVASAILHNVYPQFSVATIGSRFHSTLNGAEVPGIPAVLPSPSLPWGGVLSLQIARDLFPSAFAIAILAAIESLLSAVIADGMTGTKHDPNAELVGLGIGNIIAPFFGGIAATGALARTATNIKAGARSPISSVTHSVVILLSILLLAPLVAYVPMAALAALLFMVAWNMSEITSFIRLIKISSKSDVLVLITCFGLTVFFDMVLAVSVGIVLAAILFMKRMSELTGSRIFLGNDDEVEMATLPKGIALYEINGPLFFGAAQKAIEALQLVWTDSYDTIILHLAKVPLIDSTGLVALDNAIATLIRRKKIVVLAGLLPIPKRALEKAGFHKKYPDLQFAEDIEGALLHRLPTS